MKSTDNGPKGIYDNCLNHLTTAGLRIREAADMADISVSSIGRILRREPVLVTTIARLINALNRHHFIDAGRRLDLDTEVARVPNGSA